MKKWHSIFILMSILANNYSFAQTAANPFLQVTFCNVTNDTLKFSDIDKCTELSTLDKNSTIYSFKMTITFPSQKNKGKMETFNQKNNGGKLSATSVAFLKEAKKRGATQMTINDVVALEGNKLKGLAGMVIFFSNK